MSSPSRSPTAPPAPQAGLLERLDTGQERTERGPLGARVDLLPVELEERQRRLAVQHRPHQVDGLQALRLAQVLHLRIRLRVVGRAEQAGLLLLAHRTV